MSALFCLIILLPIIPTSMPHYLQDLFEIFLYLATWNCNNTPRLTEDQLIHLQFGLSTFFQRLYGMYPCNFTTYLRDHAIKENKTVFVHTIKPLLETVKMHPMLLTSSRELEKNSGRWKEMEPHDVVVECSKFSLDSMNRIQASEISADSMYMMPSVHRTPINDTSSSAATTIQLQTSLINAHLNEPFYSLFHETTKTKEPQKIDNIWSPLLGVLATPPPPGTIAPHTPTPSIPSYAVQTIPNLMQQQCASGASPPEAAVEATPETTPMKDNIQTIRPFPVNSPAVRSIWGLSQPSSPLKKDPSAPYRFTDTPITSTSHQQHVFNIEGHQHSSILSSPKLMNFVNERSMYQNQMQMINDKLQNINKLEQPMLNTIKIDAAVDAVNPSTSFMSQTNETESADVTGKILTNNPLDGVVSILNSVDSAQEDAEVTEINSLIQETTNESLDEASAAALHIPHSRSMKNYAQRFQQWKLKNKYCNRASMEYSKSCPVESALSTLNRRLKKASIHQNGNSSPSDNDDDGHDDNDDDNDDDENDTNNGNNAIGSSTSQPPPPAITKQNDNLKSKLLRSKRNNFAKNSEKISIGTQTMEQASQSYEQIFLELIAEESKSAKITATTVAPPMSPHTLLDQYIETTIKKKQSNENNNRTELYRDQIQLLNLQLQYERYRREVHAERNRRLLGKSRVNAALEMDNAKLREQKDRLSIEVEELTLNLNKGRIAKTKQDQEYAKECNRLRKDIQHESDENKQLRTTIETMQRRLSEEKKFKNDVLHELEGARAEIFDLRNELKQTQYQADLGLHYKDELNRLQSEVLLMGEIQIKCKEKLSELNNLKARDAEIEHVQFAYNEEVRGKFNIKIIYFSKKKL